jgi:hypothetical protein
MNTYTIRKAYHWTVDGDIEIESENLLYAELGEHYYGVQCASLKNHEKILKKCFKISKLIKQIDKLNQTP